MKSILVCYGLLVAIILIEGTVCMNTQASSWNPAIGRGDLSIDPWMGASSGHATVFVASSTGSMPQGLLDRYEQQNGVQIDAKGNHIIGPNTQPRYLWDNYLGGVPPAPLDSDYGPGGEPALKTTDPFYLEMGAQYDMKASLPIFLQETL